MTNRREYMRNYYRERRKRIYESSLDPEKHPLRIWRKANGISMAAAGRLLDVSDSMVWQWERYLTETPEWVREVISDEMTDYMLRKLQELDLERTRATKDNPLRKWRAKNGLSRGQLAAMLNCSKGTIACWEQNRRAIPKRILAKIQGGAK